MGRDQVGPEAQALLEDELFELPVPTLLPADVFVLFKNDEESLVGFTVTRRILELVERHKGALINLGCKVERANCSVEDLEGVLFIVVHGGTSVHDEQSQLDRVRLKLVQEPELPSTC